MGDATRGTPRGDARGDATRGRQGGCHARGTAVRSDVWVSAIYSIRVNRSDGGVLVRSDVWVSIGRTDVPLEPAPPYRVRRRGL